PRPTPAQLNTFGNWINKGAVVQTVTAGKVNQWAKTNKMNFTKSIPASSDQEMLRAVVRLARSPAMKTGRVLPNSLG
ncbi:MAG: hypothetical protein IH863_06655, partial [Chloroflexi bacterium]|nr:hypothetical protein [Chloroflexota bacterium]